MSEENQVTNQQTAGTAEGRSRRPTTDEGFFSKPAVRRTLVRHVAAYLLVAVGILLFVRLTPDIGALLGVEEALESAASKLPSAAAAAAGNAGTLILALFAFLLTVLVGPVVAGVVGVLVAVRERAERTTLTLASGLGGFLGYLLPMVVLFLLVDSRVPTASIGFGDAVANGVAMSVPSALVAAGMTYLTRWD
jgi:hypothetical protein